MIPQKSLKKKVFRLIQKNRLIQALELVEKERTHAKNLSVYYALYGIIHIYLKNWQEAELFIQKSLQMNPFDVDALHAQAYCFVRDAYFAKAKSLYKDILTQERKNKKAKRNLKILNSRQSLEKTSYPNLFLEEPKTLYSRYSYILAFILILASYFLYDKVLNLKLNKEKNRGSYSKNLYLTSKQLDQKKNILRLDIDLYSKKITLNELLLSNLSLEEKIFLEHEYRHLFFQKNYINHKTLELSSQQLKKILDFPELFDGIQIRAEGTLERGIERSYFHSIYGEKFQVLGVPENWNSNQKGFFLFQLSVIKQSVKNDSMKKKKIALEWLNGTK